MSLFFIGLFAGVLIGMFCRWSDDQCSIPSMSQAEFERIVARDKSFSPEEIKKQTEEQVKKILATKKLDVDSRPEF